MYIVLEDLTLKAKKKLFNTIIKGIVANVDQAFADKTDTMLQEETLDYILPDLLNHLEQADCEDFYGTEGWQHAFGVAS